MFEQVVFARIGEAAPAHVHARLNSCCAGAYSSIIQSLGNARHLGGSCWVMEISIGPFVAGLTVGVVSLVTQTCQFSWWFL